MVDVEEIKTKLVQDYRQLWINKHKFELIDDEVDIEDCNSKMGYIVQMLMFITGWTREAVGESLASHLSYIITFDPQDKPKNWDLVKFDYVEVVEDTPYSYLEDFPFDGCRSIEQEGFIIQPNSKERDGKDWVWIPKGTVMRFDGPDCNGWPTFTLRMRYSDIELDFAGEPFKVNLI